jgi:hypothetical protein
MGPQITGPHQTTQVCSLKRSRTKTKNNSTIMACCLNLQSAMLQSGGELATPNSSPPHSDVLADQEPSLHQTKSHSSQAMPSTLKTRHSQAPKKHLSHHIHAVMTPSCHATSTFLSVKKPSLRSTVKPSLHSTHSTLKPSLH